MRTPLRTAAPPAAARNDVYQTCEPLAGKYDIERQIPARADAVQK
jgi:hypothetical protein